MNCTPKVRRKTFGVQFTPAQLLFLHFQAIVAKFVGNKRIKTMKQFIVSALLATVAFASALAFDYNSGRASLSPYPERTASAQYPDSLTPVFINHVGRHGSRYPASSHFTMLIHRALERAEREKTITPLGRLFKADVERVISATANRWGELDT